MEEQKKLTWFRQMDFKPRAVYAGLPLVVCGAAGVGLGIRVLWSWPLLGLGTIVFCGMFVAVGLSLLLPCFCRVDVTDTEVLLRFRKIVLRRIPKEEIHLLGPATMKLSSSGIRPTEVSIIVLSTRSPVFIKTQMGRRGWEFDLAWRKFSSEEEKEYYRTRGMIRDYFSGRVSVMAGLYLRRDEGIWLEYTPERAAQLVKLLPRAENYIY